jgi:hypothetical protein
MGSSTFLTACPDDAVSKLALFIVASVMGGLGGFLGSVLGNAFGREGLFAGGFIGGALLAPVTAWVARWRRWIEPSQFWPVAVGAGVGFLAAATLAVNTLSSPIGPLIATTLTGLGAVAGAKVSRNTAADVPSKRAES